MSYNKLTAFAVKDTMADNNPLKVVRGKEFDDEFDAITTAMNAQDQVIAGMVTTPTGGIIMFGGVGTPGGFLPCDGAARSRSTYATLFQAVGTTYGAGDGSTTFNTPNLVGRFPYGGSLGQLGGSADSTLPSHSHLASVTIIDPGHTHTWPFLNMDGTNVGSGSFAGGAGSSQITEANQTGVTAVSTIAASGVAPTNANLPPFIGLSFIIKI